ncbi:hypothetical protein QMK19_40590 [Streptomyces sp. H10-C2]|uniref:hypothetical protein n=1 Tax=unclassified Streptomyces TaxID=2593676 RepID=UPI0024B8BCFE|nr:MULTISPECIES: hypothetical protein [unclassified Streptomyces]MDJ0347400.1 hypothetical protein [Streptomyces sp. PH10-H1]MDJ0375704.1 hypothetical protein [Streptomyces sp. H10-C2]
MTQEPQGHRHAVNELVTSSRTMSTLMSTISAHELRGFSPQEQAEIEDLADAAGRVLDDAERLLREPAGAVNATELVRTVQATNRVMDQLRERVIDRLVADNPAPDHP